MRKKGGGQNEGNQEGFQRRQSVVSAFLLLAAGHGDDAQFGRIIAFCLGKMDAAGEHPSRRHPKFEEIMQLSSYNIIVDNYPTQGEHLVYNTRTQALVKINQELRDILDAPFSPTNLSANTRYANELSQLSQMGILVESKAQDVEELKEFFKALKYDLKDPSFYVTVLTTSACNFKCKYCFEESSRDNFSMDLSTCDAALRWIKKKLLDEKHKQLTLTFYGGEPFLNEQAMEYLALNLGAWCAIRRIGFKFLIQTNGYLLTAERVERYKNLGLSEVRVSLDGVGNEHDANRPLRGGGGTFDTIIRNIVENADRIKIGLSVSYDEKGVGHIERLLNYLEGLNALRKLGKFICSPIHASLGPATRPENIHNSACMANLHDENLLKATMDIDALMEKKGLPISRGLPVSSCSLGRKHGGVTIDPHGRLYACNAMVGHPDLSIGHVHDEGLSERHKDFLEMNVGLTCSLDCPYLPICNGGCRFMSFLENKKFDAPSCKKRYLDIAAPELIKREYEASLREEAA